MTMKIYVLANPKGGSGKSTLCRNLAVTAFEEGLSVAIIDTDPQQSTTRWHTTRTDKLGKEEPALLSLDASQLKGTIENIRASKQFDVVFVDTIGKDEEAIREAIRLADVCIVPCKHTADDLAPVSKLCSQIGENVAIVESEIIPKSSETQIFRSALSALGTIIGETVHRVAYKRTSLSGEGVTEHEPKGKAAEEIKHIWEKLKSFTL